MVFSRVCDGIAAPIDTVEGVVSPIASEGISAFSSVAGSNVASSRGPKLGLRNFQIRMPMKI